MFLSGIVFIYSNVSFDNESLPFKINDSMILRVATAQEIDKFREHLSQTYGGQSRWIIPFDHEPKQVEEDGTSQTIYSPSSSHRWWVVAFNGNNSEVSELSKISILVEPKLHLGCTFMYSEADQKGEAQGVLYGNHAEIELLSTESRKKYESVDISELVKLKRYYEAIVGSKNMYKKPKFALELYYSASKLPIHSELLTLSLFSIIESIVAHKPRLTETLDSITHQIKNKLNLLSKRFDIVVDHEHYFGVISYSKLWGQLYSLRSDIAHGQSYEFVGSYSVLKSLENVNIFLDKIVRELIKLSVDEYDLISDLREC